MGIKINCCSRNEQTLLDSNREMERRFPKQKMRQINKSQKKGKNKMFQKTEFDTKDTDYDLEVSDSDDDVDLELSCFNGLEISVFKIP